jgi:uncharacterized protein YceK
MYAHLSKLSVSPGQDVTQGQQIGEVGNSGWSNGAHLHYELRGCASCASIASSFAEGIPTTGNRTVTSQNSPDKGVPALTPRIGVINGCGALYSKDGPPDAAFVLQTQCDDARGLALGGNRIAVINGCGAMFVKDGPPDAAYVKETECGDARAIATTQSRMAVINGCGALFTKDGPADAAYVRQTECDDAQAVALGGNRIAVINGCGAMFVKDGPPDAAYVKETECGDARAIATTQSRMAVINGCGALFTKDGPADAAWIRQTECNDARSVALNEGSAMNALGDPTPAATPPAVDPGGLGDPGGTAERDLLLAMARANVRSMSAALRGAGARRLGRRGRIALRLHSLVPGRLRLRVVTRRGRKSIVVVKTAHSFHRPDSVPITLRLTRRGRALIRRARARVPLRIRARFSLPGGNDGPVAAQRIRLRRAGRRNTDAD